MQKDLLFFHDIHITIKEFSLSNKYSLLDITVFILKEDLEIMQEKNTDLNKSEDEKYGLDYIFCVLLLEHSIIVLL